jgi:Ca2+-dependent lipid-binding protein
MEGAGKTPVFNQDFEFMIEGYDEEITLGAYDKESVKKDDFIGSTVLKADDLIALAKREDSSFDVEIHFKGKLGLTRSAGRIFLSAKYIDFNVQIEETKSEEIQFDAP